MEGMDFEITPMSLEEALSVYDEKPELDKEELEDLSIKHAEYIMLVEECCFVPQD